MVWYGMGVIKEWCGMGVIRCGIVPPHPVCQWTLQACPPLADGPALALAPATFRPPTALLGSLARRSPWMTGAGGRGRMRMRGEGGGGGERE